MKVLRHSKSIAVFGLTSCLFLSTFAQGPGGVGSGGGGLQSWWGGIPFDIGGNWHAEAFYEGKDTLNCWMKNPQGIDTEYKFIRDWKTGALTKNGASLSEGEGFPAVAINSTGNQHEVSSESRGKVMIKLQWIGSTGEAPEFIDILMNGAVEYSYSEPGSGTGANGIGDQDAFITPLPGSVYGNIAGKKVRRFKSQNGIVSFFYEPSSQSASSGVSAGCSAQAQWMNLILTLRAVRLTPTSLPGGKVKELTGEMGVINHYDWSFPFQPLQLTYPKARIASNTVYYTVFGQQYNTEVALSLKETCTGDDPPAGFEWDLANVQGAVIPSASEGTYTYSGLDISAPSEHLSLAEGWDVLPWEYRVRCAIEEHHKGLIALLGSLATRDKYNSTSYPGNTGTTDSLSFNFLWDSDGAEGNAFVAQSYKYPVERHDAFGSYEEEKEPDWISSGSWPSGPYVNDMFSPYKREAGFSVVKFSDGVTWASNVADAKNALWDAIDKTWEADGKKMTERVKAGSGFVGLVPKAKVAATAVGVFADLYAKFFPWATDVIITRKYVWLKKAYLMGMIYPMPVNVPEEGSLSDYEWLTMRRPLYIVYYFADDKYSKDGYEGQTVGYDNDPNGKYDERQAFREVGVSGGA